MKSTHLLARLAELSGFYIVQSFYSLPCAASCALLALKNCLQFLWSSLFCVAAQKVSTTTSEWVQQDREYLEAGHQSVLGFSYLCLWVHYIKKEVLNMCPAPVMQYPNFHKLPLRSLVFESFYPVLWNASAVIGTDENLNKIVVFECSLWFHVWFY